MADLTIPEELRAAVAELRGGDVVIDPSYDLAIATVLAEAASQADRNAFRPPRHQVDVSAALALARIINGTPAPAATGGA